MSAGAVITLLTDFGTADGYVGEMKGVLATLAPGVAVVDIAHDIAPHDVDGARLALDRYWRAFPPGTVHLVVVDPGVGSARVALAVASGDRLFVGPDNGVLSPALAAAGARAIRLDVPAASSATFHGRDVFAPAAAKLATGADVASLGQPCRDPIVIHTPQPRREGDAWIGEVIAIDRFGNAITNLRDQVQGVELHGRVLRIVRTYADLSPGEPGVLRGSSGYLEIAAREANAAALLGVRRGTRVTARGAPPP